jgi:hypothetical protein
MRQVFAPNDTCRFSFSDQQPADSSQYLRDLAARSWLTADR